MRGAKVELTLSLLLELIGVSRNDARIIRVAHTDIASNGETLVLYLKGETEALPKLRGADMPVKSLADYLWRFPECWIMAEKEVIKSRFEVKKEL
jgi:hypothetical protein